MIGHEETKRVWYDHEVRLTIKCDRHVYRDQFSCYLFVQMLLGILPRYLWLIYDSGFVLYLLYL
jgi:hypothetical protein